MEVVNISKQQLTTPEKSVLNKGLNFATTIKQIPYVDLIAPIEDAALEIPKARTDELKWCGNIHLCSSLHNLLTQRRELMCGRIERAASSQEKKAQ